jgi:hypothetical protein
VEALPMSVQRFGHPEQYVAGGTVLFQSRVDPLDRQTKIRQRPRPLDYAERKSRSGIVNHYRTDRGFYR